MAKKRIERVRNGGEWTEAKFWGYVRAVLRRGFRYWKPIIKTKIAARRTYVGVAHKQKYEYQCARCEKWFPDKEVQVDHIIPVGSLKCYDDLAPFLRRLTPEEGFQVLCKNCHKIKTQREKNERKKNG